MPYKPEFEQVKITRTAAGSYNQYNYPGNAIDDNISTRWSADGDGQWIWLQLASSASINHVELAFLPDQKYKSYFNIYASKDNSTWEPVLVNAYSCDFSGGLQVFNFPGEKSTTEYSYLKVIGNGNSVNKQNNLSEIRIFGYAGENPVSSPYGIVSVYPNPVRDFLNVEFSETTNETRSLQIFDLSGKLCLMKRLDPGAQTLNIPIDLSPGVYFMKVVSGNIAIFNKKLIVAR
jgi:hypothetical protein